MNSAGENIVLGNSEFGNGSRDRSSFTELLLCNFLTGILSVEKRPGGTTCSSNRFSQPAISLLEECRGAALWAGSGKHAPPLKPRDIKSKLQLRFLRQRSSSGLQQKDMPPGPLPVLRLNAGTILETRGAAGDPERACRHL